MGIGPIAWKDINDYFTRYTYLYDNFEVFLYLIRSLDNVYLEFQRDKNAKQK